MKWQIHWPMWWKLWPSYKKFPGEFGGCAFYDCVFSLGPFQCMWRKQT